MIAECDLLLVFHVPTDVKFLKLALASLTCYRRILNSFPKSYLFISSYSQRLYCAKPRTVFLCSSLGPQISPD